MIEKELQAVDVQSLPFAAGYNWSVGSFMEKFIKALGKKEILASKCPKCGYTHVPPRLRCVKCDAKIEDKDIIKLSGKGILVGFTKAYVQLDGSGNFLDLDEPQFIGAIKLEGADSTIFMPIADIEPQDIKEGIKVQVKWEEQTQGAISDIKYFTHYEG